MTFSPLIDQRPLIPSGSSDCFEASLGMVLQHLGHNVSMAEILAVQASFTDIAVGLDVCIHFGLQGCYITGSGFDNVDKLVIALFHDNSNANPDVAGPFEHYGVVYDQPGGNSVQMANPWGARDINYPDSVFNPAYIAAIVIPVSINTEGAAMTPAELQNFNSLAAAVVANKNQSDARGVEWAYALCLGRTIEPGAWGDGTLHYWLGQLSGISFEAFIAELLATPESKAFMAGGAPDLAGHPGATAVPRP